MPDSGPTSPAQSAELNLYHNLNLLSAYVKPHIWLYRVAAALASSKPPPAASRPTIIGGFGEPGVPEKPMPARRASEGTSVFPSLACASGWCNPSLALWASVTAKCAAFLPRSGPLSFFTPLGQVRLPILR